MSLSGILHNYRNSVTEANSYIYLAFQQDSAGNYLYPINQRNFITDAVFLKVFIAWETFLEQSFISYMIGEPSIKGSNIIRYVQPQDENHACKLLIGTQKYVDWSNPEIIRKLSLLYFATGNPIDVFINSLNSDLLDLKTIRNAAAHLSTTTRPQLDSLGTRKLKRPCNSISVSDLIFSIDPDSNIGETFLTTYLTKLDIGAEGIANG